jgi:hypothetical protein
VLRPAIAVFVAFFGGVTQLRTPKTLRNLLHGTDNAIVSTGN